LILLLLEFDLEIKEKKGCENVVADHLSRLVNEEVTLIEKDFLDKFPDGFLLVVHERPCFSNMENFKVTGVIPKDFNWHQRKMFFHDAHQYVWDDLHLFKIGANNLLRRCVSKGKSKIILWQ